MAQVIDALDLPQLCSQPPPEVLLDTLRLLALAPPSWDINANKESGGIAEIGRLNQTVTRVRPEGIVRYLTSIVSSGLKWIDNDEAREIIWTQASLRLSERSGRTAMGAVSRKFRVPTLSGSVELGIHEPALTGDDLGLKTWAASYLLAKRLSSLCPLSADLHQRLRVLELGSGTGLVGLAMACLGADVVLTDLPSICSNLALNAENNYTAIAQHDGTTCTAVLDWRHPTSCRSYACQSAVADDELITGKFSLILAADSLYSPSHPCMLVNAINHWLSTEADAMVITEFPQRDAYMPELEEFRRRMESSGYVVLKEGKETGLDDWGQREADGEQDERAFVTCWWSCWLRQASS